MMKLGTNIFSSAIFEENVEILSWSWRRRRRRGRPASCEDFDIF